MRAARVAAHSCHAVIGVYDQRRTAFTEQFVRDLGTALHVATVLLGDRLGLYEAMADGCPVTPGQLAQRTGTTARYVAEWLAGQAAAGYVDHDGGTFRLPPEHAPLLAGERGPAPIPAAFRLAASTVKDEPMITEAFRTGRRVCRSEHHPDLFAAAERLAGARYGEHVVGAWLPGMTGGTAALDGATVADIGCGRGAVTLLMVAAFPRARFVGYDAHAPSIDVARRLAERAGLGGTVRFECVPADAVPLAGHRLVTTFGTLHGVADPVAVAARIRSGLAPGGGWLLVEPCAGDRLEDNLTPLGKIYYNASAMISAPAGDRALGAQAGARRLREIAARAGFTRFHRLGRTATDTAYEVR